MLQNHISVCVCTYKRPELLAKLLDKLPAQESAGLFTYSVVIVDNDEKQAAKSVVEAIQQQSNIEMAYYAEPRPGISYARNMAVEKTKGNLIAFIDDDEFPDGNWLLSLFKARIKYNADGVIGAVLPYFEQPPPAWLTKGKICFWRIHPTGTVLNNGNTGNVLFKREILELGQPSFDPDFGLSGGEDSFFFQKLIKRGFVFVACSEAVAYEFVPAWRMGTTYLLKRYFLNGANTVRIVRHIGSLTCQWEWFLKSIVAIVAYPILLPVSLLSGLHLFMEYLLKISYFGGVSLEFIHMFPTYNRS